MRVVLQRVSEASVAADGIITGSIARGLLILAAFANDDTEADLEWMSGKIVRLRVFDDPAGIMNRSVQDVNGDLLLVSQFTLLASTRKGNRPSYSRSAAPEIALPLYQKFIAQLSKDLGKPIFTGKFGAHMVVRLANDGPVTIVIDSRTNDDQVKAETARSTEH